MLTQNEFGIRMHGKRKECHTHTQSYQRSQSIRCNNRRNFNLPSLNLWIELGRKIAVFWFLSIANMHCHFAAYKALFIIHFSANYFPLFYVIVVVVFVSIFIQFFSHCVLGFYRVIERMFSMFYGFICEIRCGLRRMRETGEKIIWLESYRPYRCMTTTTTTTTMLQNQQPATTNHTRWNFEYAICDSNCNFVNGNKFVWIICSFDFSMYDLWFRRQQQQSNTSTNQVPLGKKSTVINVTWVFNVCFSLYLNFVQKSLDDSKSIRVIFEIFWSVK